MNQVFGKPFFKVNAEEMFDNDAREENGPPSDLFVFNDQTHIVRSSSNGAQGLRALAQGRARCRRPRASAATPTMASPPPAPKAGTPSASTSWAKPGRRGTRHSSIPTSRRTRARRRRSPANSTSGQPGELYDGAGAPARRQHGYRPPGLGLSREYHDDNFSRAKRWAEDERRGRSNTRFGWMRT